MSWNLTLPTILAGYTPTGDDWSNILSLLSSLTTWDTYTPVLSSSSGSPTVGNGSISGEYIRIGQFCAAKVQLTFGSSTSLGTGFISFSLPVTAASGNQAGSARFLDSSVPNDFCASCYVSATDMTVFRPISASGRVTSTVPFTWATSDIIYCSIFYRV